MKKVDFGSGIGRYRYLSVDGWRCILQSFSPSIEDFSFYSCDLNDKIAKVFSEVMDRDAALKKVYFGRNKTLSAYGWRCILHSLSPSIEYFSFKDCDLNDEKAKVFSEVMGRYIALKKLNFDSNDLLTTDGLKCILQRLSPYPEVSKE